VFATTIAARLGVAPTLRLGEAGRAATEARGARGLAYRDVVAIHPDVTPATASGRQVIAHELIHQAQARLPSAQDVGRDAAEAEADRLARAVSRGEPIAAPQCAIDLARPAADKDAPSARGADDNWHVFAASGKPYLIEARNGTPGAWVVRAWVRAAPDLEIQGREWLAPSRVREILGAIGWVDPARMDFAAATLSFHFTREYEYLPIGAEAMHATGLPPGTSAVAERSRLDGLQITLALDDPAIAPGTSHDVTTGEWTRAVQAAADVTGLALDHDGLLFLLTNHVRPETLVAGNGTLFLSMNRTIGRTLFGFDAYEAWLTGKRPERPEIEAPRLALENFFQRPIPGQLTHHADLVESGEQVRLEVVVDWPYDAPDPSVFAAPPMVTPSKFSNVAMLACTWRFERIDRPPPALVIQATTIAEALHRFQLAPGEATGTWRVTCDARFDAYFTPATFTRDLVVLSAPAAMSALRAEAFAELGADDAARRGGAWTIDLRPGFAGSGDAIVDPRAAARDTQRGQLEAVRDYLRANPISAETVAAIDRELARQVRTERLLAGDRARGWQPFHVRGTYLSRTEGLASGPLDLHGTVRVEEYVEVLDSDPIAPLYARGERYVVQLRDLSRRFEQEDFVFDGRGTSFDAALHAAFNDLAIAYPKGRVAIEAAQLRGGALGEPAVGTG